MKITNCPTCGGKLETMQTDEGTGYYRSTEREETIDEVLEIIKQVQREHHPEIDDNCKCPLHVAKQRISALKGGK